MQGVVGTAGMPWLQGIEQHFVELGDIADADAAGQGAKGSREGLRQDVKIKASSSHVMSFLTSGVAGLRRDCHGYCCCQKHSDKQKPSWEHSIFVLCPRLMAMHWTRTSEYERHL